MAELQETVEDQQSGSRKKIRWRRHSWSSVHILSTQTQLQAKPQKDNTHGSSTLNRAGHHGSTQDPPSKKHKTRGSFFKMFRSRSTKNRRLQRASSQELNAEKPILLEHKSDYIRIVATELHPQIQYKTLPITEYTTAYEVVVKLVTKFATKEEDKDPDLFYLNEEQESEQGSYSRILENNDRVHAIQSRWTDSDKKYSFILCRKQQPLKLPVDNFLHPISAVVLSPSQDSFYNTIPGMITVEEGATPSSQSTEHLMNTYFQPSVLPNEQRNGNAKNGHLLTSTASATVSIGTRVGMDGSRVDDNKIKEQSYTGAMAHTSHSTLPISPSEPSAKEASTVEILSSNSHQSILTGEGRVEQPLRNDSRNTGHQFHFPQPEQQMSSASSKANKGEMNYKQLMQGSISQGMPGIMNKVINENKDNTVPTSAQSMVSVESKLQTGRAMVHAGPDKQASPSQIKARYYSTRMGHKREGKRKVASESMVLRTLVCSPMVTASRKFPEFVFTPGAASQSGESGTNSTKVKISTDGKENRMHSSQMVQSNVSTSTVTKTEDEGQLIGYKEKEKAVKRSKGDTKLNLLARKLEFDYENDQTKFKSHSLKTRVHGQSDSKLDGKSIVSQAPYAHHCTATRSVLPVTAETTLTVPFKYHCRASLYPTFLRSAYYSTEMDIMESLHTLLDMKFKPQHPHVQENQPSNQVMSSNESPMPSTESLMDEARKSHLIFSSETPKKAKSSLKRPHSFHYRRTDSSESSNLESPTKRELLMRKAAEAVKQRTKKAFSETEFDLDTVLKQQTNKPGRLNARQVQGSDDYAKSMENLTMTDTRRTLPGLNPYSQKLFSSSSYSLQGLPTRHASFREHPSSRTSSNYTNHHNALPKRSKSFHESSKSSQSMEALHIISGPFCKEEGDEELLYTFERKRRPVTVLVRSTSSLSVNQSQTAEEAKSQPAPQANSHPSNLMTMKAISSQGLALSEFAENQSNHSKFTEGTGSQKRFSRNRPTSAPAERAPHSSGSSGDNGRESSRLDGLMTSIYLKSDKLWWHEF